MLKFPLEMTGFKWCGRGSNTNYSSLRVVVYTDLWGVGRAEISLGNLVSNLSSAIELTVLRLSEQVVRTIATQRPGAAR
ncbi:MAG: hypothetical protein KME11_11425 [Timaviella obliquedivisa GSE-PSE-MK23-08B]|nr:hypothetical protein [Timaviella obliquedivisa GSE-PSE-MK23-08B]